MADDWTVLFSEEVSDWFASLAPRDEASAERAFDLLRDLGPTLRMPHSKSLGEGLYELRFTCEQVARRVTYAFDPARKIITLTTFRKQRDNERREVKRARAVLKRSKGER